MKKSQRKKYTTEFEETEADFSNAAKQQPKKRSFSLKLKAEERAQAWVKFKGFIEKCLIIILALIVICMGHVYGAIAIILISSRIYGEVISQSRKQDQAKIEKLSWIDWYAYAVCAYCITPSFFLRRELLIKAIQDEKTYGKYLDMFLYQYRSLIGALSIMIGMIAFLVSLKKGITKIQLRKIAWTLIVLLFVFVFSFIQIYNLYKGIFWVIFPLICVPINSLCSSFIGIPLGITPLNKNLPSKTLEGYIGGLILTCIFAFYVSDYMTNFYYMICPQTELSFALFEGITCEISDIYIKRNMEFNFLTDYLGQITFQASPAQIHAIFISMFASLISPFGQFCVISLKKAFRIQVVEIYDDVASLEGAINDIFRVQGVLAVCVFFYITQMVFRSAVTLEKVVYYINQMNDEDKIKLLKVLNDSISNQSMIENAYNHR
eukprot:403338851